jgi:hypothetical protein
MTKFPFTNRVLKTVRSHCKSVRNPFATMSAHPSRHEASPESNTCLVEALH